jgi:outer membrane lipoprotein-sorting protein
MNTIIYSKESKKRIILAMLLVGGFLVRSNGQTAEDLIKKVKEKLEKVTDYEASGQMKTNVAFIKAPIATVKVYFKRPDKIRINNEKGISFIPKGSVNINLNTIFLNNANVDVIDLGKEEQTGLRIIKLLPRDEESEIVLTTLYVDERSALIKRSRSTTRENGTYELEMTYGKYADYGLADKVIFIFNTKDYKLPKGVTFDYDVGKKKEEEDKSNNKKGKVEITYNSYIINKGVPDSVFE